MPDSSAIGADFSNYQGNAGLGNIQGGALTFDMRPAAQLAAYVNLENKTFWEQKQQNADKLVDALSKTSNLDVNLLYGKDRDEMIGEMGKLNNSIADTLQDVPSDPGEYAKWFANAQQQIGQVAANYATKKQRTLDRASQIGLIQTAYPNDPVHQANATDQLNKEFDNTNGPLESIPLWQPIALPKPNAPTMDVNVINNSPNSDFAVQSTVTLFNHGASLNQSLKRVMLGQDLNNSFPPKQIPDKSGNMIDNPAYATWAKGKSPQEISFASAQTADPDAVRNTYSQMAQNINSVFSKYVDKDGNLDSTKFLASNPDTATLGMYNHLMGLSTYSEAELNAMKTGGTLVSHGISFKLPTNLDPTAVQSGVVKDWSNITPVQLAMADDYGVYEGDKVVNKDIKTNNRNQALNRGLEYWKEQQQNARSAADRAAKGGSGSDDGGIQNPAILFGTHVQRVKDFFQKNTDPTKDLNVPYSKVDADTRQAIGMTEDDKSVDFRRDGSYQINGADSKRVGTLEQLKQGYIDVVKGGKDPTQNKAFQSGAEGAFNSTFGSNVGQNIWNNWNSGSNTAAQSTNKPSGTNPVELKGQVDPNQLQKGQSYSVNGKNYTWDGSKLNAQ